MHGSQRSVCLAPLNMTVWGAEPGPCPLHPGWTLARSRAEQHEPELRSQSWTLIRLSDPAQVAHLSEPQLPGW